MAFDFDAAVSAPFRMQPGLRRLAPGSRQLTPTAPGDRWLMEKLAVLTAHAPAALLCAPGFDAQPALGALYAHAQDEWPDAWRFNGRRAEAPRLGWAVEDEAALPMHPEALPQIGTCLAALPPAWRLPGLLALAFAEDFAVIDAAAGRIAWMAVCLPSHWAPESKIGRSFAEVHAPVADNALLVNAGERLLGLVSGSDERWERFVWTITAHARLCAHPRGLTTPRWPAAAGVEAVAALAHWRTEHQSFLALPRLRQAVFTIHVEVEPLAQAIATRERAAALHAALVSMSAAVLAYRSLAEVREPLLRWLARAAAA